MLPKVRSRADLMPESANSIDPAAPFLQPLVEKLRRHPKRIVFPEGNDPRVLAVAAKLVELRAAAPILLGDPAAIRATAEAHGIATRKVLILAPEASADFELFCRRLVNMERFRRLEVDDPRAIMARPDYFAAMMVQYGQADAIVGGNQVLPAPFFRALFQMIRPLPGNGSAASAMILVDPANPHLGRDGVLFLADCAVIPHPTVEELAMIAVEAGRLARDLLGRTPKVALLSFSTKGSNATDATRRVAAATAITRDRIEREYLDIDVDGEIQADVALVPEISVAKGRPNLIHGEADVLVFPDLNSGNIASKLLQHVAGARSYGQIVLGLARPAAQVSRAVDLQTLFGTSIMMGIRAIQYRELIAEELATLDR